MSGIGSLVLAIAIFVGVLAIAGLLLWLVLGRGKKGEDRMTGVLKEQSIFRGSTANNPGPGRPSR